LTEENGFDIISFAPVRKGVGFMPKTRESGCRMSLMILVRRRTLTDKQQCNPEDSKKKEIFREKRTKPSKRSLKEISQ